MGVHRYVCISHLRTPVSSVTQSLGVMNVCRRITEPAAFTYRPHKTCQRLYVNEDHIRSNVAASTHAHAPA